MDNQFAIPHHAANSCHGSCCGSHGHNLRQSQVQQLKVDKVHQQRLLSCYTFDIYGRLFGEVERALAVCKVRTTQQPMKRIFAANVLDHDLQDLQMMMMNIEGFCQSLFGFDIYTSKENLQKVKIDYDQELWNIFNYWAVEIDALPEDLPNVQASKRILKYVVDSLIKDSQILELPDELQELILTKQERDKIAQEFIKDRQFDIISMVTTTQNLSDNISSQAEQLSQSDQMPAISTQPLIHVTPEDLNYKKQDGSHLTFHHTSYPELQNQPTN
jgi:hypothetical protein